MRNGQHNATDTAVAPQRHSDTEVRDASLREVMRSFPAGVTVLTTGGPDSHGMTANAFTSVSVDPPLVLCCVGRNAGMRRAIAGAESFGVSILADDQEDVARYFANRHRPGGRAQFDAVDWRPGRCTGAPLLTGAAAWLECRLDQEHEGGDHSIFVGEVLSSSWTARRHALLFFSGAFQRACGARHLYHDEPLECCW